MHFKINSVKEISESGDRILDQNLINLNQKIYMNNSNISLLTKLKNEDF